MIKIEGVIFDMDGVLIGTENIWKSFNIVLSELGVKISLTKLKEYNGMSLRDQIQMWKKDFNIKQDINVEQFSREAGKIELGFYAKKGFDNKKLIVMLENLKSHNIKMAVATSSLKWRAEKILDSLEIRSYFGAVVTAEDVEKHKPNPDLFLRAAQEINANPKNCIVIEDAPNGIAAAIKAEMKVVALFTNFHTKNELSDANLIINNLDEIKYEKLIKIK